MNITQFAIERNRLTFTILFVIILMGLAGYQNLSRDSMPPYTVRVATVVTEFPGASPERVEQLLSLLKAEQAKDDDALPDRSKD